MKYMYNNQRCKKIYECFMFRIFPVCLKDAGGMEEKGEILFCTFTSMWVCFQCFHFQVNFLIYRKFESDKEMQIFRKI